MDEQECNCSNCKQERATQEGPAEATELDVLLEAFLRGDTT